MKLRQIILAVLALGANALAYAGTDVVLVWLNGGYQVVAVGTNTYYMDRFYFNGGPWSGVQTYYNSGANPEWYEIGTQGDPTYWWDVRYPSG